MAAHSCVPVFTVKGKRVRQLLVAVDAEIGRYQPEFIALFQVFPQVVGDGVCLVVEDVSVCHGRSWW